jgi:hypothetical protein
MKMAPQTSSEQGNALFLILIAVVLFAALAYAISRSEGGNANVVAEDQLNITYSKFASMLSLGNNEFARLRLRGCSLDGISVSSYSPAPQSNCEFFANNGGNFPYTTNHISLDWFNTTGAEDFFITLYPMWLPQMGTDKQDIAIIIVLRDTSANEALYFLITLF